MTIVSVTQEHIDNGEADDCKACPIALALCQLVSDDLAVHVSNREVDIYTPHWWRKPSPCRRWSAGLPSEATVFIKYFDVGATVEPFSFELDIPAWALRESAA